ncbi:MAG: NAD(+) synthase [Bacteroidales bacterium]|nr:NAD(+) synthase [Bacteroidales bacterium]MCD8395311.1 NAD(+) synthase [Bacteroidales bacterium]
MVNGFLRVAATVPKVTPADCAANVEGIIALAKELDAKGARLIVFPELCITGYTCGDLFHQQKLLDDALDGLQTILAASSAIKAILVVGMPLRIGTGLYNCAVAVHDYQVLGIVPKCYIPNYNEFYEKRWFHSGYDLNTQVRLENQCQPVPVSPNLIINARWMIDDDRLSKWIDDSVKIGIEICEDLWSPTPRSTQLAMQGADVIVNLSASNDLIGKYHYLTDLIRQQSGRLLCGYVYAGAGWGESSTDLVFDGKAIIAECGSILGRNERWTHTPQYVIRDLDLEAIRRDRLHLGTFTDAVKSFQPLSETVNVDCGLHYHELPDLLREVVPHPFVPSDKGHRDERCSEIINIQVAGLARRLDATRCRKLVVGISGGLDSTLALLVAVEAFDSLGLDRKGIIGVTMPGFGTTKRTKSNAALLMETLGVTIREIPIGEAVNIHFRDIGHDPEVKDVTYENSQARERTQILMDLANQEGGMVLGTGDLSELALGWATYNGDHMSMYGVNASVPKTLVKYLVQWFADRTDNEQERRTLLDIIDTPVSPELLPADTHGNIAQKTEDLVGPYELHDFFLYYTLRYGYSPSRVLFLAEQAFNESFNRATILNWLKTFYRRFFNQQFKRSCLPDGPKVGSVCLSPRGDWRMPSDASARAWIEEIANIKY